MRLFKSPLRSVNSLDYRGFSMVELLVALLFTAILMAGLATVFRASLGTFVASSEKLSSARRNRMAGDMIFDDLNAAGMLPTSLKAYPAGALSATNPGFQVIPNVPYVGTDVLGPNDVGDQLFLYFDELLPFEGTITTDAIGSSSAVATGASINSLVFSLSFQDSQQADAVLQAQAETPLVPLKLIPRASAGTALDVASISRNGGRALTLVPTPMISMGPEQIPALSTVLLAKPGRYVRYSIQPRNLDPDPANAGISTPCLIRDEVAYALVSGSPTPFAAPLSTSIVAENVIGFQVMLSPDGGQTWINNPYDAAQRQGGLPSQSVPGLPHTRFTTWSDLSGLLNTNAAITGRPGPTNRVDDTQFWFKDIIQGDGYRGLKDHHPWEQGVSEAMYVIENLS